MTVRIRSHHIKLLRTLFGLSQLDLARMMLYAPVTIKRLESGSLRLSDDVERSLSEIFEKDREEVQAFMRAVDAFRAWRLSHDEIEDETNTEVQEVRDDMEQHNETILTADDVRTLRYITGMSQAELAERIVRKPQTMHNYETGVRNMPIDVQERIWHVFDLDHDTELLEAMKVVSSYRISRAPAATP